jgi:Mg2+ and Co2+ transporter CorA
MQEHISELRRENQRLQEMIDSHQNNTLNMSTTNYEEKMQRVIRDYLDQIQDLREENEKLKSKQNFL